MSGIQYLNTSIHKTCFLTKSFGEAERFQRGLLFSFPTHPLSLTAIKPSLASYLNLSTPPLTLTWGSMHAYHAAGSGLIPCWDKFPG